MPLALESVLGSIASLPGESIDLDQEIAEAAEVEAARVMQRLDDPSPRHSEESRDSSDPARRRRSASAGL
jgi:hypothetical protein